MPRIAASSCLVLLSALGCSPAASSTSPPSLPATSPGDMAIAGAGGADLGAAPDGAVAAASCTGKTATRRGLTQRSLTVAGANRTYLVYIPQTLDPNAPVPLLFVHHGFTMSGQAMHDITRFTDLADQYGFAVSFPDGESGPNALLPPWNVGSGVCGMGAFEQASGDAVDFLQAMKADIAADQCLDDAHVFVTGFSMGGYFSHEVGCAHPELARAIAPHSGGTHDFGSCVAGHTPVIIFHGTGDTLIDPSCARQARDQWVAKNGCSTDVDSKPVQGGHCEWSKGCPADGQVVLCLFDNLAHAWAGGAPNQSFSDPNYASASELAWSFFRQYAW